MSAIPLAGEVARYIGRHGTKRVAMAVLISAVPPLMLKTASNPAGTPIEVFDQIRKSILSDRSQYWKISVLLFTVLIVLARRFRRAARFLLAARHDGWDQRGV